MERFQKGKLPTLRSGAEQELWDFVSMSANEAAMTSMEKKGICPTLTTAHR